MKHTDADNFDHRAEGVIHCNNCANLLLMCVLILCLIVGAVIRYTRAELDAQHYPRIEVGKHYMCAKHSFPAGMPACKTIVHHLVGDSSLPNVNKKFLFTIHITMDSTGQTIFDRGLVSEVGIRNAIRDAGEYFSKIGISFEAEDSIYVLKNLAYDVMGTTDELTESATLYARDNRINLFLISEFEDDLAFAAGIAGGNYMHIASTGANAGTIAHETGHIFSLEHTFGTGDVISAGAGEPFETTDELVDGSNCSTAGDFVCDTPADPYVFPSGGVDTNVYFEDCIFVNNSVDANGDYYDPLPGNIMSYYDGGDCFCASFLTDGQLRRVAKAYYASAQRFSWW